MIAKIMNDNKLAYQHYVPSSLSINVSLDISEVMEFLIFA